MLSERLKQLTLNNHQLLEKKMVSRMKSIRDINDYAVFLGIFYSFFGGLERLIGKHLDKTKLRDYDNRRKAGMLSDDLISLTGIIRSIARSKDLPAITNHLQAIGALYVIEGSTLGGQIIGKMITKQLGMAQPLGMSYFTGYGDKTLLMWQQFKQNIDGQYTEAQQEEIIKASNNTFVKFGHWFDTAMQTI